MSAQCKAVPDSGFSPVVREAVPADLDFLESLERDCFSGTRQSSRQSLRHSLTSASQMVFIAERKKGRKQGVPTGAAVVFEYKRSLRVYSLAILKEHRMQGMGEALMQHIIDFALSHGYERISLEADAGNPKLVDWYRQFGFEGTKAMPDYYGPAEAALRMVLLLANKGRTSERIVIVVDDSNLAKKCVSGIQFCSAPEYLSDTNFSNSNRFHILNLCNSYKTHSMGYYVSLLASARNHRITPSVMAVKDGTTPSIAQSLLDEIREYTHDKLPSHDGSVVELTIVLGKTDDPHHGELARKLFSLFSIPFFSITMERHDSWRFKKLKTLHLKQVAHQHPELLQDALTCYCEKKRYNRPRLKSYKYDLAILINEEEGTPPSCPLALEKFRKAAERVGFFVEFITKADHRRLCEFDALFMRETTAIENHTYEMARHAYTEGLVVIDDPWSILLCSNKVYLHERLANAGVCQPRGWLLTRKGCSDELLKSLPLPVVLKLPESSFSQGVYRVCSLEELRSKLHEMFRQTDLVIAQEFLTSDYDWRIGLLDNMPLFACKYYMANNHWQIYNWQSSESEEFSGRSETIPVSQIPAHILKAAVNASSLIGNGLYGVDLKEVNKKAYVIEVNDNPNIDAGIEDLLLGDELYERIMHSLYNRIEAERHQVRYLY
ncbi:GNAT family N-acetyltransferase [Pseudodesulfovibrio piezophilus]|uniref:GCN5-related N-acetyltransferase n=1 Tax=Pseudodesulfovibrio piezophilus (strain DSM 21447 / JCM 15486 / C1TLV30) TaxID=1322246 RepID=M1WKN9_PSEP2|nr:GNAT family N-acetyltransferase [Pseudodesulfovibrio piezophilus]CCH49931.1 GCN5-related N-acetyltransferase [Pseudodesulfovibrio piezophilus C1TLV30]